MRRIAQFVAGAILFTGLVLGAAPAHAAEVQPQPEGTVCATNKTKAPSDNLLPLARHGDATGEFHTRLNWTNVDQKFIRGTLHQTIMQMGNFLLGSTLGLTKAASTYCPLDTFGYRLDKAAATIGDLLLNSMLLTLGVVVAVVAAIMRSLRGGMGAAVGKALISKAFIVALFVAMLAGANATTESGHFGVMSPGWFANGVDAATTAVATGPALAIHEGILSAKDSASRETGKCGEMSRALDRMYADVGGGQAGAAVTLTPRILSGVWSQSGLRAWQQVQFGDEPVSDDGKAPAEWTYCHYLEMKSGVAPSNRVKVLDAIGWPLPGTNKAETLAANPLFRPGDDVAEDIAIVAWAACNPGEKWALKPHRSLMVNGGLRERGTIREGEVKKGSDASVSPEQAAAVCTAVFGDLDNPPQFSAWGEQSETGGAPGPSWLDWGNDESGIIAATSSGTDVSNAAQDFLLTIHGNNKDGLIPVFSYGISAISIFVVFAGLALVVLLAKTASVVMIVTVFFVLLAALFGTGAEAAGKFAKRFVGVNLFAAASIALLAVVSLLTSVLAEAGSLFPASIGILWVGITPVVAAWLLHRGFKKLHLASPFTPGGAMGYATSLSKGGFANAMGGFNQMSQPGFVGRTASQFAGSDLAQRFNPFGKPKDAGGDGGPSAAGRGRYGMGGPRELKPGTPGASQQSAERHQEALRAKMRDSGASSGEKREARKDLWDYRKDIATAAQERVRKSRGSWAERAGASFAAAPVRNTLKAAALAGAATISMPAVATAAVGYGAYKTSQKVVGIVQDDLAISHGWGSGSKELQAAISDLWAAQDAAEAAATAAPRPNPHARPNWEQR